MGCIDRDENAVNNMVKIVKEYIEKKERPLKFRRDYKFPEKIKDDNPNITKCNKSVKYHQAWKGAIIFFLLKSVPFFSEKGVILPIKQ